ILPAVAVVQRVRGKWPCNGLRASESTQVQYRAPLRGVLMHIRALAAAAATLMMTIAAEADGPPPGPSPPVAVACCEPPALWTGVYLGTHLGGVWSNPTWTLPLVESFNTIPGQSFSPSGSGAVWGGHLGVNYQFQHYLIGAEVGYAGNRLDAA